MNRRLGLGAALLLVVAGCSDEPAESPAPSSAPPSASASTEPNTPPSTLSSTPEGSPVDPQPLWRPDPASTWQYQLSGALDLSVEADVYDVDWEETTADQVRQLHEAGRRVVCYVNAGAFEEWRPDAGAYPADVLGEPLDGWPGERWVDVRRTDVLLGILGARMDMCLDKGFDAVEADNVDGYTNETGFDLTATDQLAFNSAVAGLAHERGLAVALKNDVEQVAELEPFFDFAVNEECLAYDECAAYAPFVRAGKAVLHVEYAALGPEECARAREFGLSTIVKAADLPPPLTRC